MLHLDLPSAAELIDLATVRADIALSLFLPTTPSSLGTDADRIALKKLAREATGQMEIAGVDQWRVCALSEELDDLIDDGEFWRYQAQGLAIYATPDNLRTFRVPKALAPLVAVSDRFHLKPLLRSISFCNACCVLALADTGVHLIEVSADLPAGEVTVLGMPKDLASTVDRAGGADLSHSGRPAGAEGQKVQLRQYARKVDGALRGLLAGSDIPLILAAVQGLGAIYRSVNTYPYLAAQGITGDPEHLSEAELAVAARAVLDGLYRDQITKWTALFRQRARDGLATTDLTQVGRAATVGAVQSLLVDLDQMVPGTLDETSGTLRSAPAGADAHGGDLVDEIARRALLSGAQVLGVRQRDIPEGKPLAAILRYAI